MVIRVILELFVKISVKEKPGKGSTKVRMWHGEAREYFKQSEVGLHV